MLEKYSLPIKHCEGRDQEPLSKDKSVCRNIANLGDNLLHCDGYHRGKLLNHWSSILGKGISLQAYPARIKNGILFIICSSPIWAQEIKLQEPLILERFNENMPPERQISKLKCNVGNIPNIKTVADKPANPQSPPLSNVEQHFVQLASRYISNPELRQVMEKAHSENLANRKWMLQEGAQVCSICRHPSFYGNPCIECKRLAHASRRERALKLLSKSPWLKYQELKCIIAEISLQDYVLWHKQLNSHWRQQIHSVLNTLEKGCLIPANIQMLMIKLTSLVASKPYKEITSGDVLNALWKRYGEALLSKRAPGPFVYEDKGKGSDKSE